MDIRFLNTFLEVSETRHFGRAAENLYLTQSAVSARIKLLEEYFNTQLFIRNRNSIQITPAGEKLIPFAQAMSAQIIEARQALSEEDFAYITLCATQAVMPLFLNAFLPNIINEFEHISIRHRVSSLEQITKQLHEHSIDFAFTTSALKSDDIDSIPLLKINLAKYTSISKNNNAVMSLCPFIDFDYGPSFSEKLWGPFPDLRKAKLKTCSPELVVDLMSKGYYQAIMPSMQNRYLDKNLSKKLKKFDCENLLDTQHVPIFLNKLKNNPNQGLEAILSFIETAC